MIELSVVIPTFNRASLLSDLLNSVCHQTLSSDMFEVIVIDNGSTDTTMQVVGHYRKRLTHLRYFFDDSPGLHVGRHRGMQEAQSETLVYADDDIEPLSTWLETIAEDFQDQEVVLVGGKNLPKFESAPPDWINDMWRKNHSGHRILSYLSILDLGNEKKKVDPSYVYGCNFAIRRSALLEVGGFHPDSMPEDKVIYRGDGESHVTRSLKAQGRSALYDPLASVQHYVPKDRMTVRYFRNRSYRQGISDSYSAIRGKGCHFDWSPFRLCVVAYMKSVFQPHHRRKICSAYWKGYYHHQWAARQNTELRKWIEKENYF